MSRFEDEGDKIMLSADVLVIRLMLAAVCGGVIGYQRERKDRPAGFRTHILVALGSALFMIVSEMRFSVATDPTRIAAQVVTGIGFLGAGTIIRQGNIIMGLTTAASLWSVAAVGLAAGAGYFLAAVGGTIMIFLALSIFKILEIKIAQEKIGFVLVLESVEKAAQLAAVHDALETSEYEISSEEYTHLTEGGLRIKFHLSAFESANQARLPTALLEIEGVRLVRLERVPEKPALF